ncbi:MAG: type II secretion system protein [Clostridia bacterium]|nr:type II secretion system protein [Clostridia bacterium]
MKRNNKKGFTIVELVIVIAVIAILAGVLIPTFSGVVKKAQESAAVQEAKTIMTNYTASIDYADGKVPETNYFIYVKRGDKEYYFKVTNGKFNETVLTKAESGKVVVADETGDGEVETSTAPAAG